MKIRATQTSLPGLLIIDVDYFKDARGFFMESWNRKTFSEVGISDDFVQDSHSASSFGVLRGMHYQDRRAPLAKLVRCTVGKIFDVAIDLRLSSPTFGKWFGMELSSEDKRQLYIPVGFAHGFSTLSDYAEVQYKQTGYYNREAEGGIAWDDPEVAIAWPTREPLLSIKDQQQQGLRDYRQNPAFD